MFQLSKAHDGFLVKQHRPFYRWMMVALYCLLLIVTFFIGRWDQDRSLRNSYEMIQDLNTSIDQLNERNNDLVINNVGLSADSKVDRDAYKSVNESLISLQQEILSLKEELVFYRGIVAPSQVNLGINLQEFEIRKSVSSDTYRYKIVLTKTGRSKFSIRGDVSILVTGLVDGKSKTFTLNELSESSKNELKYSFKYFQIFEGDIKLLSQFYPELIKVKVKSRTKKVKSTESTFNWAELVFGES